MIPYFPIFKKLEISDRSDIEFIIKGDDPYSDFNFVSLWSYNIKDDIEISILQNCLILKLRNYLNGNRFLSISGHKINDNIISAVINYALDNNISPKLSLIPECAINNNLNELSSNLEIIEDRDNFDYIISLEEFSKLKGNKFHNIRINANRFKREYPNILIEYIDLNAPDNKEQIINLFNIWKGKKNKTDTEGEKEFIALKRLLANSYIFQLFSVGLFEKDKLVGFFITEMLSNKYVIAHFIKADQSYKGIFEYLYFITANKLYENNYSYLNLEQDLGIEGLRKQKLSFRPVKFLKKYVISKK